MNRLIVRIDLKRSNLAVIAEDRFIEHRGRGFFDQPIPCLLEKPHRERHLTFALVGLSCNRRLTLWQTLSLLRPRRPSSSNLKAITGRASALSQERRGLLSLPSTGRAPA